MISSFWFLFWWGTKKPWKNRLWRWLCQSLLRGENEAIRWVRRNPPGSCGHRMKKRKINFPLALLWFFPNANPSFRSSWKKIFPSFKFCSDPTHSLHYYPVLHPEVSTFIAIVSSYPISEIRASEDKTSSKFQTWNISSKSLVKTDALEFLNIGKWLLLLFSLKVYFLRLLTASL